MKKGILYIVATPIGNLDDISKRAIDTLGKVDFVLSEDTRVGLKLLKNFDINSKVISYHHHSGGEKISQIVSVLSQGKNLALITDAGTPGIADPGNKLINEVVKSVPSLRVVPIPGPSAVISALSVCGFNTQEFIFLGWPPHKKGRETWFKNLAQEKKAIVFYESVYRVKNALERIVQVCPKRNLVVCRELTKKFETVYRGVAGDILEALENDKIKGEFVVVLDRL